MSDSLGKIKIPAGYTLNEEYSKQPTKLMKILSLSWISKWDMVKAALI